MYKYQWKAEGSTICDRRRKYPNGTGRAYKKLVAKGIEVYHQAPDDLRPIDKPD